MPQLRAVVLSLVIALGGLLATAVVPPSVTAQDDQEDQLEAVDPASERSAAFRAVEGPQTEDVPGGPLLIGAYGVIWALVMLYVIRLGRMQSRTSEEVERLERSLAATERGAKD